MIIFGQNRLLQLNGMRPIMIMVGMDMISMVIIVMVIMLEHCYADFIRATAAGGTHLCHLPRSVVQACELVQLRPSESP
jgi:hypothetical protein